ncbi:uncharacterized protein LOC129946566 [Eupeodes corollae]|uniref:uncharacterized protein LOC129946566 n=1 Tax=Eupeodes corollae TaxID=290404 RepID=UPI002490D5E2|nr:uncharacterized protein LOC129946566 [Eupeodes corollae]
MESFPQSMYQSDFQQPAVKPRQIYSAAKRKCTTERSNYRPIQMDFEVLQPFKQDVDVPFSLIHENKPILQTNPHSPIPEVKLKVKLFGQKLEARSRRLGVYMTPQINLDKINEETMYGDSTKGNKRVGLVDSIYSSDWKKACEVVAANSRMKLKEDPKKTRFVTKDLLEKSVEQTRYKPEGIIPPMDMELKNYISLWDSQNQAEFVDRTKLFLEKKRSTSDSRDSTKALNDEEKAELEKCYKEDTLRTPFALHPPGYTGYIPRLAKGIQIRKKKFSKYDPFVTTLMAAQGSYDKYAI